MFFSPLEQFDTIMLFLFTFFGYDFSFSLFFISFLFLILFLILFSFFFTETYVLPNFWQFFFENIYFFILDIIYQQIGIKGFIYLPFIFTLFIFILISNLISLTPYGLAITSHIILIFVLSISIGFSSFILGLLNYGFSFFKIFIPNCPFILVVPLIILEIFSYFIKFFSLAIRLSANIMAGHTLVHIISQFFINFCFLTDIPYLFQFFGLPFIFIYFLFLAILVLELGVAFLQAYVFVVLVSIYFADCLNMSSH